MRTYLTFGKYNGLPLSDPTIPISYLSWLASPGGGKVYANDHTLDAKWKAPKGLWVKVREELVSRGYELRNGEWKKKLE